MVKKVLSFTLCLLMLICSITVNAEINNISVSVDGVPVQFDVTPRIINDRVMVPIRAIFESIGALVVWDDENKSAYCYGEDKTILISLYSNILIIDDNYVYMDAVPLLIDGRILVPARYAAEAFGYDVEWIPQANLVQITSQDTFDTSNIVFYNRYNDVPDFGLSTDAVLVSEMTNSFAYYGLSDNYNRECINKYKNILKRLKYVEVSDNLFKNGTRTIFIHIGNTAVGKMIFIMIDPPNL